MPGGDFERAKAAYERNDLGAADRYCRSALAANPVDVAASMLYAFVCARTGRKEAAIVYLRNVLERRPDSYEAHVALSSLLFFSGKPEEGERHAKTAIDLRPDDPESYAHLARDLAATGRADEALTFFDQAVNHGGCEGTYLREVAKLLSDCRRISEAISAWERYATLRPDDVQGWVALGRLKLARYDSESAVVCGRRAIEADDRSAEAHMMLALALSEKGFAAEAEPEVLRALELKPDDPVALATLGLIRHELGRFDEARPSLEKSIELWPTNGLAYYTLFRTRKITAEDEPLLARMTPLARDAKAGQLNRSYMHYALGKAWEDRGEFETSMSHFDQATALAYEFWFANSPWDRQRYRFVFDRTIDAFTAEKVARLRRSGNPSEVPLLVVGMIRSGTTLVEQILSSHPQVSAAGELTYWHEEAGRAFDPAERAIDEEELSKVGQGYLNLLRSYGPNALRVTDKLPHNFALLGPIHAAFPNARVIHVRRNPLDNCLSIYTTAYPRPPAFTLRRDNIVLAYREYRRMVAHWRSVLPGDRFLEIDYEDLIADRQRVTRRLVDFAGLEWSDACLHHESNKRAVNTPSAWQVRQPIYRSSVERWRKFEPWLRELEELKEEASQP